jgi:hypothetical protein
MQCPQRFLDIIDQDPSVSKSNRFHVDIFRFSLQSAISQTQLPHLELADNSPHSLLSCVYIYMRFKPMKQIASIMCTNYTQVQKILYIYIYVCHMYACKLFLSDKVIEVRHMGSQLLLHN